MDLNEIKNYMRIDEDNHEDDLLISALTETATQYIEMQTGKKYINGLGVWNLAILVLVLHWYDNRGVITDKTADLPHSINALINHIALCSGYDEKEATE